VGVIPLAVSALAHIICILQIVLVYRLVQMGHTPIIIPALPAAYPTVKPVPAQPPAQLATVHIIGAAVHVNPA